MASEIDKAKQLMATMTWPETPEQANDLFEQELKRLRPKQITEIPKEQIEAIWLESNPLNPSKKPMRQIEAETNLLRYDFTEAETKKINISPEDKYFNGTMAGLFATIVGMVPGIGVIKVLGAVSVSPDVAAPSIVGLCMLGGVTIATKIMRLPDSIRHPCVVDKLVKNRHQEIARVEHERDRFHERAKIRDGIRQEIDKTYAAAAKPTLPLPAPELVRPDLPSADNRKVLAFLKRRP